MPAAEAPATRVVLRSVLVVLAVVSTLYVVYLLRKPLGWLVVATFLAIAISGPVNLLSRRMPRGAAILISYLVLVLVPILLAAIVVPPLVRQGTRLANDAPSYAQDVTDFVNRNRRLRKLEREYDITGKLQEQARKLPEKLGDAASTLKDVGVGVVNSLFAAITILFLSVFMVADGRRWVRAALTLAPRERAERLERTLDRIAVAVGNFVAGAIAQALVAGTATYIVLKILGVPFAGPLAVIVGLFDLIPLVGATIAAVFVGIITLFNDFPTATIIWTVWAIVYQQVENNLIQPQIQRRAVDIHPFVVLVSVLFGSALFGVVGALLAIPAAASIQIAITEWWHYRAEVSARAAPGADDAAQAPA